MNTSIYSFNSATPHRSINTVDHHRFDASINSQKDVPGSMPVSANTVLSKEELTPAQAVEIVSALVNQAGGYGRLSKDHLDILKELEPIIAKSPYALIEYAKVIGKPFEENSNLHNTFVNTANEFQLLSYQINVANAPFVAGSASEKAFLEKASATTILAYNTVLLEAAPLVAGSAMERAYLEKAYGHELVQYQIDIAKTPFDTTSQIYKTFLAIASGADLLKYQEYLQAPFTTGSDLHTAFLQKASSNELVMYAKAFNIAYSVDSQAYHQIKNSIYWNSYKTHFNITELSRD